MTEMIKLWTALIATAWRDRRTEDGGLTDDVAMMAMLVAIAALIVGALFVVLGDAIAGINFDVPGT